MLSTESDLKEFLYPIANNLQQSDFKKLQCFFAEPTEISYQEKEQIPNAMKLFDIFVTRHVIMAEKLGLLWNVLKSRLSAASTSVRRLRGST